MPSWKKVIVSGAEASLSSLNVDGTVTANSFAGDGSGLTGVGMDALTFNQNLSEAFEIDGDDFVLADTTTKYIVDRRWEVDSNGDVMPREVMLFTSGSTVSYLED